MSSIHRLRPAAALLLCLPAFGHAQSTSTHSTLDTIVVTATRTPVIQRELPGDVTVIDRTELEAAGQDSLADVLSRQSGIETAFSGGPQTQTSVFLRGTSPQQTLVLIDGMRINSLSSGATNWNAIDPAMVERVEIVRGAASSLYGSNAIGGVINIITRRQTEDSPPRGWLTTGVGTYDTFRQSAGVAGASDGWNYAFSAGMAASDGFNATTPDNNFGEYYADRDGYSMHSFSGSLGHEWAAGQRLDMTLFNGYTNGDFDAGEWSPEAYGLTRQEAYTISSTNQLTDRWESRVQLGFASEKGDSRSFGSAYTFGSLQRSLLWQNRYRIDDDQEVSLLLERLDERARPGSTDYTQTRRTTNAVGMLYRAKFGDHRLQASVRNDNISSYGNKVTGGLAYDYALSSTLTAGIAANTGFRAPTFADLYSPYFYGSVGNPDLKPESSRNIEASLRYLDDTTLLEAVVYQNRIDDMIVGFVYDPATGTSSAQNIDRARLRGLTLRAEQRFGNTTFKAGADFLDPRNETSRPGLTGKQLQRRARQVYRLGVDHRQGAMAVGGEYLFVGKRYDDAANQVSLPAYGIANLTASYALNRHASVQVRWDNVFNKEYSSIQGYSMPGSNVFISLTLRH